jgi:GTP-binding protein Era
MTGAAPPTDLPVPAPPAGDGPPGPRRCGFVAVIGAPNAGKSTLVNRFVGEKVTIVSPKVQTTRMRVMGVAVAGATQIVFVDTPGIFVPKRRLERAMVKAAWRGAGEADIVLLTVDAARRDPLGDNDGIIGALRRDGRKAVLALNKIDLVKRERLLQLADAFFATGVFSDVFMISAEKGDGIDDLFAHLLARMPEGPWHFPPDQLTDLSQRLIAAEIVREQLFRQLHQELPYSLTVEPEEWEEFQDGSVRIRAVILVDRESHKPIVLGKGGQRIKSVRVAAQQELERMLGRKVHLLLHVVVQRDWLERREHYGALGLDFEA